MLLLDCYDMRWSCVTNNMLCLKADYDFLEWTQDFHQQGTMTCLCPGTASWNRSVSPEQQYYLM
jgi:hypothetical protein